MVDSDPYFLIVQGKCSKLDDLQIKGSPFDKCFSKKNTSETLMIIQKAVMLPDNALKTTVNKQVICASLVMHRRWKGAVKVPTLP